MDIVTPESAGFSSSRLCQINRRMQGYVDDGKLAGALTVLARDGDVFHQESYGVQDLESGTPTNHDTIFRIFSMTKPIASVAAMMLLEEGHYFLDDPVSDFIPELANLKVYGGGSGEDVRLDEPERPVSIRHLLTHTAGMGYGFDESHPVDKMYREARVNDADSNLKEFTEKISRIPLLYQPGTKWRYSNATTVLGYLVEVVSGVPFDEFLRDRIFEPLGMKDTSFFVPEDKLDRLAAVYAPARGGGIARFDNSIVNRFERPHTLFSGGAGLVSTAGDYMRFCQMMLDGGSLGDAQILSRKTVDLMRADHLTDDLKPFSVSDDPGSITYTKGCGFGLGFCVVTDIAQHGVIGSNGMYYWSGAASTIFWIDPVEDLVAIFLTQFMPSSYYPVDREFQTDVYQALIE